MTDAKNPRHIAFGILNRVEGTDAYADILLDAELGTLAEIDRALATEITYGVLRWRMRLDHIIDTFSSIKAKKLEHRVLTALRIGLYQLFFLTRIPASAAVNESVNLVRQQGKKTAGFVNAILRNADRDRARALSAGLDGDATRRISIEYSHPEWLVRRWIKRFGAEFTTGLCKANQQVPPKTLRANTLVNSRDELVDILTGDGIEVKATRFSLSGIEVLNGRPKAKDNRYYIQDEASQLIAHLISPEPGEHVLDACSAPGGKTTHMAELMRNKGVICGLDTYPARLKSVEESAARLGITIIKTIGARSEVPLPIGLDGFDAVLLDAPCTGLGVIRRAPEIKYRRQEKEIREMGAKQARLLENLCNYVKKGGRLVYSTCTFEPEETTDVITGFLEIHPEFGLEDAREYLPSGCAELVEDGLLKTYPHIHSTDGFFGARLRRL